MAFLRNALLFLLIALVPLGCSRKERGVESTARVVPAAAVSQVLGFTYTGDTAYAEVSSASLKGYYDTFRSALFADGVVKWDERYDCNHFAGYYVAKAQTGFYLANFHGRTPAQTLALGTYWYRRGGSGSGHAIVAAITERGLVFIEPQNGQEVSLTPAEQASAFLKVF